MNDWADYMGLGLRIQLNYGYRSKFVRGKIRKSDEKHWTNTRNHVASPIKTWDFMQSKWYSFFRV